jgi:hypothetical protein
VGDEQYARWWLQFRDIVSPHRHEREHFYALKWLICGLFNYAFATAYSNGNHDNHCTTENDLRHVKETFGV